MAVKNTAMVFLFTKGVNSYKNYHRQLLLDNILTNKYQTGRLESLSVRAAIDSGTARIERAVYRRIPGCLMLIWKMSGYVGLIHRLVCLHPPQQASDAPYTGHPVPPVDIKSIPNVFARSHPVKRQKNHFTGWDFCG